jgi:hypothetical protein
VTIRQQRRQHQASTIATIGENGWIADPNRPKNTASVE